MQKIIIRYLGSDPEMRRGTLTLEKPYNPTRYYEIADVEEIAKAKSVTDKEVIEDTKNQVLYCFCTADGYHKVYIYKGGYIFDPESNKYLIEV